MSRSNLGIVNKFKKFTHESAENSAISSIPTTKNSLLKTCPKRANQKLLEKSTKYSGLYKKFWRMGIYPSSAGSRYMERISESLQDEEAKAWLWSLPTFFVFKWWRKHAKNFNGGDSAIRLQPYKMFSKNTLKPKNFITTDLWTLRVGLYPFFELISKVLRQNKFIRSTKKTLGKFVMNCFQRADQ